MKYLYKYFFYLFVFTFFSCNNKTADADDDVDKKSIATPVTVASIMQDTLSDFILLNATSSFLQNSVVNSNMNGYVRAVNTQLGKFVFSGDILFTIKTKESESLGNVISKLDSGFKFNGTGNIKAGVSGYIVELDHQNGDYVQDGQQLAVISNSNSFAFILNLPYELNDYVHRGQILDLFLPDNKKLSAIVSSVMPQIDSASQTEKVILKIISNTAIPENLVAKVKIIKSEKTNAQSLPKQAVLSDETQNNFWVMKLINDSIAIKVPVKKGIETNNRIEILSPQFSSSDKILLTGNYGLDDSAKVKVNSF